MLNVFRQCRENRIKQVPTKVIQDLFHGLLPFIPGSWSLVPQIAPIGCEPTTRTFPAITHSYEQMNKISLSERRDLNYLDLLSMTSHQHSPTSLSCNAEEDEACSVIRQECLGRTEINGTQEIGGMNAHLCNRPLKSNGRSVCSLHASRVGLCGIFRQSRAGWIAGLERANCRG